MPPREAFRIGDIPVYWYGIMIMLGVIAASIMAYREAKRRGEDPEHVWQLFPWVLIMGVVGARAGFVLSKLGDPPPGGWTLASVVDIRNGGLSIQGAVIGGALAVIVYCKRSKLAAFKWGDIIVPGLALGQAIGRWGNYFNQEAFGRPTTLPWGIPISLQRQQEVAGQEFGPDVRFHPTFAYEMILDLLNFGLLMWLGRQKRIKLLEGDLVWVYIVVYSVGRFIIEGLRVDSSTVNGIPLPQIIALLSIVFAWGMFLYRHRPGSKAKLSQANLPSSMLAIADGPQGDAETKSNKSRVRKVSTASKGDEPDNLEAAQ